ncbi:hypothetical protein [Halosolutus gelatinilyticus]|uniref:hypothetical protein n=1 Tax=Halosolutus gelatinilyticus TaxID=2931975 RepID=UPI001FF177A3|nr:hypothetical protein [Halosolutus gelatinilyticus]
MIELNEWRFKIRTFFTKLFIWVSQRTSIEEINEVSLLNERTTIYSFRSDSAIFAQVTPIGTIIWNKSRMEGLSTRSKQLILRHECSHRDRNPIYKGILYGMAVSFAAGLLLLLISFALLALGASPSELLTPVLIAVGMIGSFIILVRIEETLADYHAIRDLGEETFIDAYNEISSESDNSLHAQGLRKVLYTDPSDTVRIYRFFQRIS